ncbi:MAG: alkaline phosphatase family protein [Anaerolineae bacterium]
MPNDWLWTQRGRPDLARAELLREADVRFDATLHLMDTRPWDMVFFVVSATDGAAHFFWKYHDPNHPLYDPAEAERYGDTLREVYRRCDQRIGELLQRLEDQPDVNVLVVSDHGQGPLGPQAVHLNTWLAGQNLLQFRDRNNNQATLGERAAIVASHAAQRGKRWLYRQVGFQTLTKLRSWWPDSLRTRLGAETFFPGVDWYHTRAFSEELRGNIWINLAGRDPHGIVQPGAEYEALRDQIVATLPALTDAATGGRPIRRVWRREELFHGPYLERFPDLIVEAEYADVFKPRGNVSGRGRSPPTDGGGAAPDLDHRLPSLQRHLHRLGARHQGRRPGSRRGPDRRCPDRAAPAGPAGAGGDGWPRAGGGAGRIGGRPGGRSHPGRAGLRRRWRRGELQRRRGRICARAAGRAGVFGVNGER